MTETINLGDLIAGFAVVLATALLMHAGDRVGYRRWVEEPKAIRRQRWQRARAAGYSIPAIKERVLPPLVGLAGGIPGAVLVWDSRGILAALGTLIGAGVLLWRAAQIYAVRTVFRRDLMLRCCEQPGTAHSTLRRPLR